jgi:Thiamine biosynthesis ATP pyrophosphatase
VNKGLHNGRARVKKSSVRALIYPDVLRAVQASAERLNSIRVHEICVEQESTGEGCKAATVVMVRYGELFLKSEPVMRQFISLILKNMAKALSSKGISHRFELHRGRLLIHGDEPDAIAEVASRTFGVIDVSVCTLGGNSLEELSDTAVYYARNHLKPGMSFAIRAKRQGVAGINSQELGARVGAAVLSEIPEAVVDLTRPDYEIFVEMRDFGGLVYDSRIPAPGGLPWGTQGKVFTLLSSGIDSPVASWLLMKRGCEVHHIHIDGGKWAGKDVKETAVRHHCTLSTWCPGYPLDLYIIDAEFFFTEMTSRVNPRFRCILCKRFMLKAGSEMVRQKEMAALVTGDTMGQVASQTLPNIVTISGAADVPVLRPLITYDKNETIRIARTIGTFDNNQGDLGCHAVPRLAATQAELEEILVFERKIAMDALVERACRQIVRLTAVNGKIVEQSG